MSNLIEAIRTAVADGATAEQAQVEGTEASTLLRTFVETGDQAIIPQIQARASAGIEQLTQAGTASGSEGIAEIGSSDAESPRLHFEIRRQGKPVDPQKFLPAR